MGNPKKTTGKSSENQELMHKGMIGERYGTAKKETSQEAHKKHHKKSHKKHHKKHHKKSHKSITRSTQEAPQEEGVVQ